MNERCCLVVVVSRKTLFDPTLSLLPAPVVFVVPLFGVLELVPGLHKVSSVGELRRGRDEHDCSLSLRPNNFRRLSSS